MTRSGVKVRLCRHCLVTCCHLTLKDKSENTGCDLHLYSLELDPLCLMEWGHVVLVCSSMPVPSSSGAMACLAVTSPACWLLGCGSGLPKFGNVGINLKDAKTLYYNKGKLWFSDEHEFRLPWVQHLTPSTDGWGGACYIIAHVTCLSSDIQYIITFPVWRATSCTGHSEKTPPLVLSPFPLFYYFTYLVCLGFMPTV